MTDVYILGLSAFYHDSAACLVRNGEIVAAAQEERFTRKKHDADFPTNAVAYCLQEAGITVDQLTHVAFYDKPFLKFERLLLTYLNCAPAGIRSFIKAMPVWLKDKLFLRELIAEKLNYSGEILFTEHHESHAASAFYPSPFESAAVLTLDGVGEWATASYGVGKGNQLELKADINFPHSLGLLYSAFTYYVGFRVNSGEYKLMGLAPYGEPKYVDLIKKHLIDIKPDGSFRLNMKYFNYCVGLRMTNFRFHRLFGGPPRKAEAEITQKHMDIARSIQDVTQEIMVRMANHVQGKTKEENLCLAGGVALNCVGNGKILKESRFKNIWIQPAAGDAGGALGAALYIWYRYLDNPRHSDNQQDKQFGSYLGPNYSDEEIGRFIRHSEFPAEKFSPTELAHKVADIISRGYVVGCFYGRMEFGPRALGARSILGDPRSEKMQTQLNLKIKFRESFRPFAPSILRERVSEYFDMDADSPYMLLVAPVAEQHIDPSSRGHNLTGLERLNVKRSDIPAVTHVDYSARVQTVSEDTNPFYYQLLKEFEKLTGCPVLINTSFNVRGEPIVCTPEDAYRCFMCTDMDYLILGNYILSKTQQPNQHKYTKETIATIPD